MSNYLGQRWKDVLEDLNKRPIPYVVKITLPRGKVKVTGDLRVVRVRENSGQVEFVLAHEFWEKSSE